MSNSLGQYQSIFDFILGHRRHRMFIFLINYYCIITGSIMTPLFTAISLCGSRPYNYCLYSLCLYYVLVACYIPHSKLLWQYQPLTVRASPGWPLACLCSSELLLPDTQSSDLPMGSSCTKHVYICGRYTNGEEGLTHVSSEMLRTFSPWYCWTRMWSDSSWLDVIPGLFRRIPITISTRTQCQWSYTYLWVLIGCLTSEPSFSHRSFPDHTTFCHIVR